MLLSKHLSDSPGARKARGAFFTPPKLTKFMAKWCLRSAVERVFEPACGEAAFLVAAAEQLRELGALGCLQEQLHGIELHAESATLAAEHLADRGFGAAITTASIFDIPASPSFDVVMGNPPFVRYQALSRKERAKANGVARAQGIRFDGMTNLWAPFLVHATGFLRPGGRLAMVLPAELLSVNYAGPARRFLLERFGNVTLVVFKKRVFPQVLEEVVIVLAEGVGPTDSFELHEAIDASELSDLKTRRWTPMAASDKWMGALLPPQTTELYRQLVATEQFDSLSNWGQTELGMVTGNNSYFTMSRETAHSWNISKTELVRISPPNARHLQGLVISKRGWEQMRRECASVYMFRPSNGKLSVGAKRYIAHGENLGIHDAFKCQVRSPWWRVPLVKTPDLFLTYMNNFAPRLVANRAQLGHLNSIHGVSLAAGRKRLGATLLPLAALNSLTLLGAELLGRSYGGGILKLEPREADNLPLPSRACVEGCSSSLRTFRSQLSQPIRNNHVDLVTKRVDEIILRDGMGLCQSQIDAIRTGRKTMLERRLARVERRSRTPLTDV